MQEKSRSWIREQLWSDSRSLSKPYNSESQNLVALRFWIGAWYTKWYGCFRKRFFKRPPAHEGLSSTIFNNSIKESASSCQELRPDITGTTRRRESEMNKKSLNTSIPSLHFQSRCGMLSHTGGTYFHSGKMNYPRFPLSEWNLGKKFPDSMVFQSWKVKTNFVHDPWVFPCNRRLWSSTRTLSDLFPISLQNDDVSAKLRFSNFWKKEQYCSQTYRLMVTTLSLSSLVGSHQFPGCDFDFFENANSMLSHSPLFWPFVVLPRVRVPFLPTLIWVHDDELQHVGLGDQPFQVLL